MNWQEQALCIQVEDKDVFFPPNGSLSAQAELVCKRCPVRVQCLDYALSHRMREGIWGGVSERKHKELERERAAS